MIVEEIQSVIQSLPQEDYLRLLTWMQETDWGAWDKQIAQDSAAGKLDFLLVEAQEAKQQGVLRDV